MKIFVKRILSNNIWEKGLQKTFEEKKTFLIKVVEGWNIWKYLKKKKIFNKSSWGVEELREKKIDNRIVRKYIWVFGNNYLKTNFIIQDLLRKSFEEN